MNVLNKQNYYSTKPMHSAAIEVVMNTTVVNVFRHIFLACMMVSFLSACGTDSGAPNQSLANTASGPASTNYSGEPPATSDTQNFKREVWDNLVSSDRCGSCHNSSTGNQSPLFVDDQNINLAYAQANTIVNLDDPALSTIVTKVAGGHNCWLTSDTACEDIITRYIQNWAGGSAGSTTEIVLRAPAIKDPGASKAFPSDTGTYSTSVYPLLTQYCSTCHIEGIQTPFIASTDIDTSYAAVQSKIDLDTPAASRLVIRLRNQFHNCWDDDCVAASQEMEDKIAEFSDTLSTQDIDPTINSKALSLIEDGLVANAGGRYEDNIIALYEFKEGDGIIANDTSGVEPALNLTLTGNTEWVGGWGVKIGPAYTDTDVTPNVSYINGKAQGSTTASKKLHDQITATGEYSIEAWVVPGNVSQEDARIVTYSGAEDARNFTLGQTLYNYDFLHRSSTTNQNEALSTADADERLQASLQHVVITFAAGQARRIYVNGEYTGDMDTESAGNLNEWDDSFAFVLGNETDGNSLWQGTLRMVAIHNRALTDEQVVQNYDVGVGEKFFLLFSVSHLTNTPQSFVVFEASQFDSYSYLFSNPYFVSLDESATFADIPVKGLRLMINGKDAPVGQAFKNIDIQLNDTDYENEGGKQVLSNLGTIIALEQGPNTDEFFLSFEQIGDVYNAVVSAEPPVPPAPENQDPVADIGLKTFDEINVSMSVMTGVNKTEPGVSATFNTIKQQLPTVEAISGFLSAHQMAVTQLSIQYCNALVEDTSKRADFFPSFDFSVNANTAFDTDGRNAVINPLLANLVGTGLNSQPADNTIAAELNDLIDTLTACSSDSSCASDRTETVVKASCAAVLGSAVTLVQ